MNIFLVYIFLYIYIIYLTVYSAQLLNIDNGKCLVGDTFCTISV